MKNIVLFVLGAILIANVSCEDPPVAASGAAVDPTPTSSCECVPASDSPLASPVCAVYVKIDPLNPLSRIDERRVYLTHCHYACDQANIIKILPNEACVETSPWPWVHHPSHDEIAAAAGGVAARFMPFEERIKREDAAVSMPNLEGWEAVATFNNPDLRADAPFNPITYWKNPAHWWHHGIHAGVNGGLGVDLGVGRNNIGHGLYYQHGRGIPAFVMPLIQQRMAAKQQLITEVAGVQRSEPVTAEH